jgi:hypothetical protein
LTISNGAVLTHAAFTEADIVDQTHDSAKEVYITTTEDVRLVNGGSINVDGKGFIGGGPDQASFNGKGLGGGKYAYTYGTNQDALAGGGGNGGTGGAGVGGQSQGAGGKAYDYQGSVPFNPGSGGGGADGYTNKVSGGAGGGRIKLIIGGTFKMENGTSISANGAEGSYDPGANGAAAGGGGSGGTIILQASSFAFTGAWKDDVDGGLCDTKDAACDTDSYPNGSSLAGAGGAGRKHFYQVDMGQNNIDAGDNNPNILISAIGGAGRDDGGSVPGVSGSGGGGFLSMVGVSHSVTIQKTLTAVKRNGVANKSFNPYALQIGDQIRVTIKLSNTTPNQVVTVTDTPLAIQGGSHKCEPDPGQSPSGDVTANSSGVALPFTYTCMVK